MAHILLLFGLRVGNVGSTAHETDFESGLQLGERYGGCLVATVVAGPVDMSGGCLTCVASPASPVVIVFAQTLDEKDRHLTASHPAQSRCLG